jgi:T5orf172 domain
MHRAFKNWGNTTAAHTDVEAALSEEQREFLTHHSISFDEVYFAHDQRLKDYQPKMRAGGYRVAVGVTPCQEHGHTMRLTRGHCAQCNPQNLGFKKIYETPGYVYVAASKSGGIVKVGGASEIESRERSLRSHGYGGYTDWKIVFRAHCEVFGRVEKVAHDLLAEFRYETSYFKASRLVDCNELFSCDEATAERAVTQAICQTAGH